MPLPPPKTCSTVGCDELPVGRWINGEYCAGHGPTTPTPDPERTLAAFKRRKLERLHSRKD
jgi:hypothetical protein